MSLFESLILGMVEGVTEFLPISSTGHLILASTLMGIKQGQFQKTFEISIQLGAILAVVIVYFERLKRDLALWKRLSVAFFPTAVIGLAFHRFVEQHLFSPVTVSLALIVWGIVFIVVETMYKEKDHIISDPDQLSYWKAFLIGIFQSFAIIPGTSRSGSTIVGGIVLGMSRKASTEFSFLLAIPTMFAATGFELFKNFSTVEAENLTALVVGFITAFVFAYFSVKWLLSFVKSHSFIPFGFYRIFVGLIFIYLSFMYNF